MYQQIEKSINDNLTTANENLAWLQKHMHPYFFITMAEETEAVGILATILKSLETNKRRILADTDKKLILARSNTSGSLYDSLRTLRERDISYAHIAHSYAPIPGQKKELELQRFEFDRKSHNEISEGLKGDVNIPAQIREDVAAAMTERYPDFDLSKLDNLLNILWLNNESYVTISPAERVAQILWLYQQGKDNGGIHLDVEESVGLDDSTETRIMFAVSNPPQRDFLLQIMEVFNRLDIGIKRTYCLTLSTGVHPSSSAPSMSVKEMVRRLKKGLSYLISYRKNCLILSFCKHVHTPIRNLLPRRSCWRRCHSG